MDELMVESRMQKFMQDVPSTNVFHLSDGRKIKNLKELIEVLKDIDVKTYNFHVNNSKNDFASWIGTTIGDKVLSKRITQFQEKIIVLSLIEQRLTEYKSFIDKQRYVEEAVFKQTKPKEIVITNSPSPEINTINIPSGLRKIADENNVFTNQAVIKHNNYLECEFLKTLLDESDAPNSFKPKKFPKRN